MIKDRRLVHTSGTSRALKKAFTPQKHLISLHDLATFLHFFSGGHDILVIIIIISSIYSEEYLAALFSDRKAATTAR